MATRKETASVSKIVQDAVKKMDPGGLVLKLRLPVQERMRALLMSLAYHGYGRMVVVSALRSEREQVRIFGKGRTSQELIEAGVSGEYADPDAEIVSWVMPDQSMHVHGCAIDLDTSYYALEGDPIIPQVCHFLGLAWGGTWRVRDFGHFETHGGY
jgi:hypothetical protein